jgi:hypothetical protein
MTVRRHLLLLLLGLPLTFGSAAQSDVERARVEYERQQREYWRAQEKARRPATASGTSDRRRCPASMPGLCSRQSSAAPHAPTVAR